MGRVDERRADQAALCCLRLARTDDGEDDAAQDGEENDDEGSELNGEPTSGPLGLGQITGAHADRPSR